MTNVCWVKPTSYLHIQHSPHYRLYFHSHVSPFTFFPFVHLPSIDGPIPSAVVLDMSGTLTCSIWHCAVKQIHLREQMVKQQRNTLTGVNVVRNMTISASEKQLRTSLYRLRQHLQFILTSSYFLHNENACICIYIYMETLLIKPSKHSMTQSWKNTNYSLNASMHIRVARFICRGIIYLPS